MTKPILIHQMHVTSTPAALTERVNAAARACHPVSSISGSSKGRYAARRTLELAWPLKVLIHVESGARFTRKRTKTRLSERFSFSSNVGSLTCMIGMGTPSVRDDRTPEPFARPARRADVSVQRRACEEDVVLRRSKAYRVVGNANSETTGYRSTGPRVCLVALS